jgi:orotate phosphoribosyltransferase
MHKNRKSVGGKRMISAKQRLIEIFQQTSFRSSDQPSFRLASGKYSKYYIDCKQALSDPEARGLISDLIFDLIRNESFDSVGGLELGAYPIATSVSDKIFHQTGEKVRAFVIRKKPKSHGMTDDSGKFQLIAGHVKNGDRALIVDDVVTSGSSTITAIRAAREAGLSVNWAVVLVDREEDDGRKNIEAENVKFSALLTLNDLREMDDITSQRSDSESAHKGFVRRQPVGTVIAR